MPRPHPLPPVPTASGALLLALLTPLALADQALRVVTWNVETIGVKGSPEYNAALDVLMRIGADVVAAVVEGALTRLRPVTMTKLAIVAALLAIMLGGGAVSEAKRRIATPLLGGC